MTTHRRMARPALSLLTTVALAVAVCGPADARPDRGPALSTTTTQSCPLERIGSQLVRCGDLTGDGVAAPLYIPEQG